MKTRAFVLGLIIIAVIAFSVGYLANHPKKYDSCKSAYENLIKADLCIGKFEEYWGMDEVIGNVEYFDLNWEEEIGDTNIKDELGGPNRRCYNQAYREFAQTGKKENLITCFINWISVKNDSLEIQCGCFFG